MQKFKGSHPPEKKTFTGNTLNNINNLVPRVSPIPFLGAEETNSLSCSKEGKKKDPGNKVDISVD